MRIARLTCWAGLLLPLAAVPAGAEVPGVATLIEQGRYWQSKGRQDLAQQAFRRALALDPDNAAAKQGLAGPSRPAPRPAAPRVEAPAPRPVPARTAMAPAPRPASGAARAAGFRALEAGNLGEAERQFERAIAADRGDAEAEGGLGLVRLRQQRFGEARDRLDRASRLGNARQWADALASARFYAGLEEARAALNQGRTEAALTQAEALVRSDYADRGPAVELLADIYERQGRYADAADLYRQAGEQGGPSEQRLSSRAYRNQALAAAARGDDVAAEQAFHSGLLMAQDDPWIRYEFARYLLDKGRQPEADSLLNALSGSARPDWLYAGALLNAQIGRASAAAALIDRIPEGQRTQQMRNFRTGLGIDGAIERARALAAGGRPAEGLAELRGAAGTPGLPAAKQAAIADALYELADTEGAAALAQQAMSGEISDARDYEPIVRVLAKTGRDAFATAAIQRAAVLAGPSADGQRAMARMNGIMAASQADRLRLAGQNATAFDLLQSAWNTAPGNLEVLAALARLYQSGGMPAPAAQSYQLLLAQSPNDKAAMIGLIETAGAAGDRDLARRTIDRALSAFPDDHEIYLAAARMEQARGDEGAAVKYLKRAREIYTRRTGGAPLTAANPFAAAPSGDNPFRNQSPAMAPTVNPFALSGGARLPTTAPIAPVSGGMAYPQGSYNAPPPATSPAPAGGDPVLAKLDYDIAALTQETGPRADLRTGYRQRSGETGLSELKELTGTVELSTGLAGGRVSAKADMVVLDAGQPSGSGLARFGRNATAEAEGIVAQEPSKLTRADSQHATGVALSAAYQNDLVRAEVGTTPIGFDKTRLTWHAAVTPRFSPHASGRAWFERRPVTDSVLSYAGTRDPVTGDRWGQVMRTGGGASLSYDRDRAGIYGDLSYYRYRGVDVPRNRSFQANIGGYMPFIRGERSSLVGGINVNFQDYANNQNYFTYGHGGYFSPQSFFSVSFPIRYSFQDDRLEARASIAPGYQSYNQDAVALYPTLRDAQAVLDDLKARNDDVRASYDSLSKTGFALSADGSIYYRISSGTRVGGEFGINTFGSYDEFKSVIGIKQTLGGGK